MESFKDYITSEYIDKIRDYKAMEMSYAFNENTKIDKKSNKPLKIFTITIFIKYYDKDMNLLFQTSLKFVNNMLNKVCANKLINISPKELENKFMFARKTICSKINEDYNNKMNEISEKINSLKCYYGNSNVLINREFQGEKIALSPEKNSSKNSKFDM